MLTGIVPFSVPIPHSTSSFRTMMPSVMIRPLNLFSAASVNFNGAGSTYMFNKTLWVQSSPIKSPILRKYTRPFKRSGMYPSISKCSVKRCKYCKHLCTACTVSSAVNGRRFSVVNYSDLDWKSNGLIYVITLRDVKCGMQYVGQTRFNEHYRRMNKPRIIFLPSLYTYRLFTKWHFYTTSGKK